LLGIVRTRTLTPNFSAQNFLTCEDKLAITLLMYQG
jgi:hypothetical protein